MFLDPKNIGFDVLVTNLLIFGYQAAILDAILNYNILPHIWDEHPGFLKLPWVPNNDQ